MPNVRSVRVPTGDDLAFAARVLEGALRVTPVVDAPALGDVVLKLETLQPTGSFKVRGGLVSLAALSEEVGGDSGGSVVAASAGNHGLGVAYAADRFGVPATIVVPEDASAKKVHALRQFGCTLVQYGQGYDEAEAHGLELAEDDPNVHFVSPYNDPFTIAGQSTIAFELLDQVPDLSTVVVPIGGGGLISGIALGLAASLLGRTVRVVGVVAEASPAMQRAVKVGHVVEVPVLPTLADGLAGNLEAGTITVELTRKYVEQVVAVDEDEIADGIRYLAFEHGVVAEGSGAVGVAALRSGRIDARDGTTALIITGRNITPTALAAVLGG